MMYTLNVPGDFEPEDHGWKVSNPIVASQQLQAAMQELHRYGFVSTQYSRSEIPYKGCFVLTIAGYNPDRTLYRVFYMRPFECHDEKMSRDRLWNEIQWGFRRAEESEGHPFASQTEK